MTFGIDFGTSNSVVARWAGTKPEVLRVAADGLPAEWNRPGFDRLFPSVIGVRDIQRTVCFGWEAKCGPALPVDAVKRMLATRPRAEEGNGRRNSGVTAPAEQELWIGDEPYRSTVAAASLFARMREGARRELRELNSAVVTIPANATGAARYRTRAAARLAGIDVKSLLNEPTAAAISYAHQVSSEEGYLLVFDWGGGTIDVTVLEHYDGIFDERASRGITMLGGLEFDEELARVVLGKLGGNYDRLSRAERRLWRRRVELTKIALSQPGTEEELFETPDGKEIVVVHREEFEAAVAPLVRRALRPLEECLEDLGLDPQAMDAVLMIGGTSQIPLVRREVTKVMGDVVVPPELCDPMTAVAEGAAITAAEHDGLLPDTDISVVTSHDLGLSFGAGTQRGFAAVIPRYSTLPAKGTRSPHPSRKGATKVVLEIVEGDATHPADDDRTFPLARLELRVPHPQQEPSENAIDVDYHYDKSGILKVKAIPRSTGVPVFDGELDCFGAGGGALVEGMETELARLLSRMTDPAPAPASNSTRGAVEQHPEPVAEAVDFWELVTAADGETTPPVRSGPVLVVHGASLAFAGKREPGKRPPSFALLSSALAALRREYPKHRIITVVGQNFVDVMDYEERDKVEAGIASGDLVTVPDSAGAQGALQVAHRLDAIVVSAESLGRYHTPFPWLRDQERRIGAVRVEQDWFFMSEGSSPNA